MMWNEGRPAGPVALAVALACAAACSSPDPAPAAGAKSSAPPPADGAAPEPGGGGDDARDAYLTTVDPELAGGCKSCHATGASNAPVFLASSPEASYQRIIGWESIYQAPEDSLLLLQGEHAGPALTAAQSASVERWLELELAGASPGEPPGEVATAAGALEGFAACMSYEDWTLAGMDVFPATQTEFGPCQGCHMHGNGGTFLSDDAAETFEQSRLQPYLNKLVRPRYVGGAFAGLEPNDRFVKKGNASCVDEDVCHPAYVLSNEQRKALQLFQAETLLRLAEGGCGP